MSRKHHEHQDSEPALQPAEAASAADHPVVVPFLLSAAVFLIAVLLRTSLFRFESDDYRIFLRPWIDFIRQHDGFGALKYEFSDYNVPYLYILALISHLPNALGGIKLVSVLFDFLLAYYVYQLVGLKYPKPWVPALGGLTVMLLPTVVTNGAMWGQCDSIYTAFAVAGLYYLLRSRPWVACTLFGLSYAFKQQALFILPLLLILALRRALPWRTLVAVPAVFLLLDIPALLIGRPVVSLLTAYWNQAARNTPLTSLAPSAYQFLQIDMAVDETRRAGMLITASLVLLLTLLVVLAPGKLGPTQIILAATACSILIPFFLPGMHERYFYLADVLSVVVALWCPRRLWYLPLLIQFASFMAYVPYLVSWKISQSVDYRILAVAIFAALVAVLAELFRGLRLASLLTPAPVPAPPEPETSAPETSAPETEAPETEAPEPPASTTAQAPLRLDVKPPIGAGVSNAEDAHDAQARIENDTQVRARGRSPAGHR